MPTLSKLPFSASSWVSSGAMAAMDSEPNSWVMMPACCALGSARSRAMTSMIVPAASRCMFSDVFFASRPIALNAARILGVAASPLVSASIVFLMPVAAISDWTPMPTSVAPSAAISPDARPPTEPSGPIRVTTSVISGAAAAVVLPR